MGWTSLYKPRGPIKDFFTKEFVGTDGTLRVIDCAIVKRNTAYIAYRTSDGRVVGVVCLLQYRPRDYYNFSYKDMDENMGPYQCECPERILKLLTPTENKWANEWREKCWENVRKRKAGIKA